MLNLLLASLALGGLPTEQKAVASPSKPPALKAKVAKTKPSPKAKAPIRVPALKSPEDPDLKAEWAIVNGMVRRGREAQARGDFALAERAYQDAVARDGGPFLRIHLAWLYDATGRDRDAYAQYRAILRASPKAGSSSSQDDPCVLARYGNLCLKFGDRMEARMAYALAVERCVYGGSVLEPKIAPRNASFDAVRAAALLCWAMECVSYDEKAQAPLLEAAERIDPANWMVRFYRASALPETERAEAQREADKALSLAPSSERARILRMMNDKGLDLP